MGRSSSTNGCVGPSSSRRGVWDHPSTDGGVWDDSSPEGVRGNSDATVSGSLGKGGEVSGDEGTTEVKLSTADFVVDGEVDTK